MKEEFLQKLALNRNIEPQFLKIKADPNPIFIFGAGAHALDVHLYCDNYNIEVEGFLINIQAEASSFCEKPVYQIEEAERKYGRFSVILGYANYPDGVAKLKADCSVANIYCLGSCAYGNWEVLPAEYVEEHSEEYMNIFHLLADEFSRQCLISYLNCRINDCADFMFPHYLGEGFYRNDLLKLQDKETLLDVGTCEGKTIEEFVEAVQGRYGNIIALEPEEDNYRELCKTIAENGWEKVYAQAVCAFNEDRTVKFSGTGEMGGVVDEADSFIEYPAVRIDSLLRELQLETPVSIVKINFLFSVIEVLEGMTNLIDTEKPKLIIRIGFDEKVMRAVIFKLREMRGGYKLFFRYTIGIPQGLTLFAV